MKSIWSFIVLVVLCVTTNSCKTMDDVSQFAATETFPTDTLLQSISPKRAMIVIAHDDDMCAMSGTIAKLNNLGWEVAVISFTKTNERNAAQVKACRNILDTVMFVNLQPHEFRNDLDTTKQQYYAIPKALFAKVFNKSIIEAELIQIINSFAPTVFFTLDNEIGGYGHPEHVLISQMVLDLAVAKTITPTYVYQSVFTDHMENTIMTRHSERMKSWGFPGNEWDEAKKTYGVAGMPQPNVQVNITDVAVLKMNYLRSYNKRERKVLGFYIPEFEEHKAEKYFSVFDREFFRIIKI